MTLALIILNWYGWGSQPRSRLKFAALLALLGLQLCCLAFAQYSITLLLFIIGIFVFFALIGIFLQRKATMALSILAITLLAVIAIVVMGQALLTENTVVSIEKQSTNAPMSEQVGLSTLGTRVQIWKCAADVMIDSPQIPFNKDGLHFLRRFIGYGPESFMATSQLKFPDALKSGYTFGSMGISQPENHYLYLGVTLGILGLLSFLWLLTTLFYKGFRLIALSKNKEIIVLTAAMVAAIVQYCAHIFFNPSVVAPELVFWLFLGLTGALIKIEGTGISDCPASTPSDDFITVTTPKPSIFRKLMSALIIIIFLTVGIGLTLPLMMANMKIRSGFVLWDKNKDLALTTFTEATLVEPGQANYNDILGHFAFYMAGQAETTPAIKSTLLSLGELAGNAAIRIEPQLAIWRYRLADRQMHWITNSSVEKKADILYLYGEADQLFPGNAVILNKWALALMLMGDYEEAGQKLAEAGKADPLWSQTSFYSGLLKSFEGRREEAGEMFILSRKGQSLLIRAIPKGPNDIDHFINFCTQITKYNLIGRVADDLKYSVADKDDWIAWTFLGIADIYAERAGEAMEALSKSAELIPDEDIAELKGVIMGIHWNTPALQAAANDILASLIERQTK
jgi:tetratricopeptide (TPR) repeat protein